MSTQPTPEELDALVYTQCPDFDMWHEGPSIDDVRAIIREAISRWGTPATGGEPVYAFRRKGLDDFCTCDKERYEELSDKPNLFETCIFYTSPQPVREPLYFTQKLDLISDCKGIGGKVIGDVQLLSLIEQVERHYGITGGQHGTQT